MDTNSDQLIRFMLPKQRVRGCFIRATNIKADACHAHGLHGDAATMFSQMLLGTIMLLSINKSGVRQVLQLDAGSDAAAPIQRMLGEVRAGCVRGYIRWQHAVTQKRDGTPDITAWMGTPLLISTVRDTGMGEPFVSTVESDAAYMADHLMRYLQQSVQTRADLVLDDDIALLLEAMPGCSEEAWFEAMGGLAKVDLKALRDGAESSLVEAFSPLKLHVVGRDPYRWHCGCQPERMLESLKNMPLEQLQELADTDGQVRVSCQYCGKEHSVAIG
ncbi:MAG: Hsp33 family molecular chaperone HslO [Mariprofundaceae bacterium]|nr:Hsp33 family molecular chaperone HslO [Mariprofundaceae bacterium]